MSNTISTAFVAAYAQDVKLAFQRQGSLLLSTVRRKTGVIGSTYVFQTLGKGTATTKSRNGLVIPMNPLHGTATATLVDRYAPEYVDKLDEAKMTYDEKAELVNIGAWALGRAADAQIIAVLDAATTYSVAVGTSNFTLAKAVEALYTNLFTRDVMDDGNVTFVIGPVQWGALMSIAQFASADYIGGGQGACSEAQAANGGLTVTGSCTAVLPRQAITVIATCSIKTQSVWLRDRTSQPRLTMCLSVWLTL